MYDFMIVKGSKAFHSRRLVFKQNTLELLPLVFVPADGKFPQGLKQIAERGDLLISTYRNKNGTATICASVIGKKDELTGEEIVCLLNKINPVLRRYLVDYRNTRGK